MVKIIIPSTTKDKLVFLGCLNHFIDSNIFLSDKIQILFFFFFGLIIGVVFRARGLQGPPEPVSFVPFFSCYQNRRSTFKRKWVYRQRFTTIWHIYKAWMYFVTLTGMWECLYRNAEASGVGSGLFLLPFPVLWSGVHAEFSDSPTLPLYKVRTQR